MRERALAGAAGVHAVVVVVLGEDAGAHVVVVGEGDEHRPRVGADRAVGRRGHLCHSFSLPGGGGFQAGTLSDGTQRAFWA